MAQFTTELRKAIGKVTSRDVFNLQGMLLIPRGTKISEEHLELLIKHQIELEPDDVMEISEPSSNQVSHEIDETMQQVGEYFDAIRFSKKVHVDDIQTLVLPFLNEACQEYTLHDLFTSLQAKDDYTYRHNLAVGMYSNLLGRWSGLSPDDLQELTTAALLHDVGKLLIPEQILNKPGKLTDEEFAKIKEHTILGYELLKKTDGINHRQALVALRHHERLDGSGYPYGLHDEEIDLFSRIVAVVDVFHAMTSNRIYRESSPFYEVLMQMEKDTYGMLDPKLTQIFIQKMMSTLIGHQVELTDGRKGTVLMLNPHDPVRPLIELEFDHEYLDLSKDYSVHIKTVY